MKKQNLIACIALLIAAVFAVYPVAYSAESPKTKSEPTADAEFYKNKIVEKVLILLQTDDLEDAVYQLESQIRREKETASVLNDDDDDDVSENKSAEDKTKDYLTNFLANDVCNDAATILVESYDLFAKGEDIEKIKIQMKEKYKSKSFLYMLEEDNSTINGLLDMLYAEFKKNGDMRKNKEIQVMVDKGLDINSVIHAIFKSTCNEAVKQGIHKKN